MRKRFLLLTVLIAAFASLSNLNAQEKKLIGDYISIGGWMNIQYDYERQLNDDDVTLDEISTLNVRRARLDIKGNINKNLEFRLQSDFAGTPKMVDAFVKVKLSKAFNIQAGQFKIPFTFENPQSPLTLEGIEYAQVISKLSGYSDICEVKNYTGGRDVGVMLYGNLLSFERNGKDIPIITYKLGVFNGNGVNGKDNNLGKDIAASLEITPGIKDLTLAASYYDGSYKSTIKEEANRNRITFGGKYDNGALVIRSEYINGDTEMPGENNKMDNLNSDGFYVAAGYWFKYSCKNSGLQHKIRPVARYDFFRSDIENAETNSTYYMVGLDWWPMENLRLLLNYTLKDKPQCDNMGHLFQAQLSVKF